MKRREFLAGAVLAPALLTLRQEPDETGFVRLFDSTSLDGWSVADGPETAFYVARRGDRGAPERGLPRVAAVGAPVRELRLPRRVLRAGLDEFRHLPARARTRPQHLVRDEDQHLPPGGREAGARVDGIDLSAGASAQGEREEQGRVEHVPHPDGLAASPGVDQRRGDPGSGRRERAGAAPPVSQRVLGLESIACPIRFRGLRVRELPSKVSWTPLYRRRRTSPSGTSCPASRSSRRSAACCTAMATASSPPTRSSAISSCRCTSGTSGITTAASCSAARGRAWAAGATRSSCRTWRARTIPRGRSTGSSARCIPGSSRSSGGCSSFA